jgi:hypothetical protein
MYDNKSFQHPGKLRMHWLGPYVVKSVTDGGVVQLRDLSGTELRGMINGSRLKLYKDSRPATAVVKKKKKKWKKKEKNKRKETKRAQCTGERKIKHMRNTNSVRRRTMVTYKGKQAGKGKSAKAGRHDNTRRN